MSTSANNNTHARPTAAEPRLSKPPLLATKGLCKSFQGVLALQDIDFELNQGEVHFLLGENGAGKSTLINVIAGTFPFNSGTVLFEGRPLSNLTPQHSRALGISPVFQEFSLVPDLTVEENLFLGRERTRFSFLQKRQMREKGRATLDRLGFDIDPRAKVRDLRRASQQMVELAKALVQDLRILILDEPTASLTEKESNRLFDLCDELKAAGTGIIYVSHRMAEMHRIADRITVMRDGRKIATVQAGLQEEAQLVEMMTGRKIDSSVERAASVPKAALVEARGIAVAGGQVKDVDLTLRAGEIIGIAGLVGCGKSEVARAIFGLEPLSSGQILVDNELVETPSPARMLGKGIAYFPSDRVVEGLALTRPIKENTTMAALGTAAFARFGWLFKKHERKHAEEIAQRLNIRPLDTEAPVYRLSGGNRQKVVLGRGLSRDVRVFLFDEPTVGIDIGSKIEIYRFINDLAEKGAAILLISSELPEVHRLAHRIYVMRDGRIVDEFKGSETTEKTLLSSFFGVEA